MKQTTVSILFSLISFSSFSQTKEETLDWIQSKIMQTQYSTCWIFWRNGWREAELKDIQLKDSIIYFQGRIDVMYFNNEYIKDFVFLLRAKICDLDRTEKKPITRNKDNKVFNLFRLCSNSEKIKMYGSYYSSPDYTSDKSEMQEILIRNETFNYIDIPINYEAEDNLYERLIKAFRNLKTFCPSKPKETF